MLPQKIRFVIICTSHECIESKEFHEEQLWRNTNWRKRITSFFCEHWPNVELETQEKEYETRSHGILGKMSKWKIINASWLVQWRIETKCQCSNSFSSSPRGWWGWPTREQWRKNLECDKCHAKLSCFIWQTNGEIGKALDKIGILGALINQGTGTTQNEEFDTQEVLSLLEQRNQSKNRLVEERLSKFSELIKEHHDNEDLSIQDQNKKEKSLLLQNFLIEIKSDSAVLQAQIHSLQKENQHLQEKSRQLNNLSLFPLIEEQLKKNELNLSKKSQQIEQLQVQIKQLEKRLNIRQHAQITQTT